MSESDHHALAPPAPESSREDRIKDLESELSAVTEQCVRAERDLNAAYNREAAREGWEPIATAPKDGTLVLLREPGHLTGRIGCDNVTSGYWRKHDAYIAGGTWTDYRMGSVEATHWMPLPDPPVSGTVVDAKPSDSTRRSEAP